MHNEHHQEAARVDISLRSSQIPVRNQKHTIYPLSLAPALTSAPASDSTTDQLEKQVQPRDRSTIERLNYCIEVRRGTAASARIQNTTDITKR